jgi:hypothetical protein
MATNAFFLATILCMAAGIVALQELQFLIPFRRLLIERYTLPIALFCLAFYLNLFALIYAVGRKLFLKDTGRKLEHLEKQLRSGSVSQELAERLMEE